MSERTNYMPVTLRDSAYILWSCDMTEQETRDLLLDNLRKTADQDSALCATQRMMTEKILQEIAGESVGQEAMMNLRILADAKSRLGYYACTICSDVNDKPRAFYDGFINILELWEEAMSFVITNYVSGNTKENTRRSLEEIKGVVEDIKSLRNVLGNEIQNTGKFVFWGWERNLLNWLIDWATRLILGYDLFDILAKEYRRLIAYLNLCFNQISDNSHSGYKN